MSRAKDENLAMNWEPPKKAHYLGPHVDENPITVSVFFRPENEIKHTGDVLSHTAFAEAHSANRTAVSYFRAKLATTEGVNEVSFDPHRSVMTIEGSPEALGKLFDVRLLSYQHLDTDHVFHVADRAPSHDGGILAVLGLDTRPIAHTYAKEMDPNAPGLMDPTKVTSYTPVDLAKIYKFPEPFNGEGQTIAIIELGGGYTRDNMEAYFNWIGLKMPEIVDVSVLGARNSPGTDADSEVQLDIQVIGGMANGAKMMVYFTPNTEQGFAEAISLAANDRNNPPCAISISWGSAECNWTDAGRAAIDHALQNAQALGITVTVAAGDNGGNDNVGDGRLHCDFPSSSPYALSCGGTTLEAPGDVISTESVWNETYRNDGATGGGVSAKYPRPAFQNGIIPMQYSGRGVPDVSAIADPLTGYRVRVNNKNTVMGGTSAVAPLWAALSARLAQGLGRRVGSLNPIVYKLPKTCFNDILVGNNDGWSATAGWDPTTGLGSPHGDAILQALKG